MGRREGFRPRGAKPSHTMRIDSRPRRPWRVALAAFAASALTLGVVAALAIGLASRSEIARVGDPLARRADAAAARITTTSAPAARAALRTTGAGARLVGADGRIIARTGPSGAVWTGGDPSWFGRLATLGASGWTLRDGSVQVTRSTPSGATLVARAPLPPGAGTAGSARNPVIAVVLLISLGVAVLAWVLAERRSRRLRRMSVAAEAIAAGRPSAVPPEGRGEWRRLSEAMAAAAARASTLQVAAESRLEALGAALAPLAHPVAARTPSGGLIRNDALERLIAGLAVADAAEVEDAVRGGLASVGAVSRRLTLSDGRALEVEGWAVPGGRVVAVGERTEQARMEAVRRQVTGSAARHLQTPISEIRALSSDLIAQVPASAAPTVRRIQAAGDRLERLVAQLLRGTSSDPRSEAPRLRAVGAAGLAYGLGTTFDRRLRDRGLRLETDLPRDLPPMRTDPDLVTEILSELIGNSAMFTPRGGTITLSGTGPAGRDRRAVGLGQRPRGAQPGAQHRHRALRPRRGRERIPGRRARAGCRVRAGRAARGAPHAGGRPLRAARVSSCPRR